MTTRFPRVVCGRDTGDPTTTTTGQVMLWQSMGTVNFDDTSVTAKAAIPNGSTIIGFDVDITTVFDTSAACNIQLSIGNQANFLGTYGVSAVGRREILPKSVFASAWYAVSAATASNTCPISVMVTSTTTPTTGVATLAIRYVVNNGNG